MKMRHAVPLTFTVLALSLSPAGAQSISEVFKKVKDSVVVVRTTQREITPWSSRKAVSMSGMGSGVFIAPEGLVLTAAHVIQTAETVEVVFTNGEVLKATIISSAPPADVALLQLEKIPSDPVIAMMGNSDEVEVGEEIFVVGAPLGITHTLSVGHISARRDAGALFGAFSRAEMFQTDAAINVGNSGGPMFNMKGQVIGIVSSMVSRTGGFEGIGFAVTSNTADDLVVTGRSAWSGFEGYYLAGELAEVFNLPQSIGVLVQRVADGSPAARLGLQPGTIHAELEGEELLLGGDVILEVMGIRVSDENGLDQIRNRFSDVQPGTEISLTVLRGGKRVELKGVPKGRR